MPKPDSDILTILEVANYLKVAERTVYRLAAAKKIPAFKVGGAWRFSRAEIDQWIKSQSSLVAATDGVSAVGKRARK
jgi:excisionase family DNA binding protein